MRDIQRFLTRYCPDDPTLRKLASRPSGWESLSMTPAQCRAARALLGWSQTELATEAAVSQRSVSAYECRESPLHDNTVIAIRRAFEKNLLVFIEDPDAEGVYLRKLSGQERAKRHTRRR